MSKFSIKALSLAALTAIAGAPSVAHADAIAQSVLSISNFTISASDPTAIGAVTFQQNGDTSAALTGFVTGTDSFAVGGNILLPPPPQAISSAVGPDAGLYAPGAAITQPNPPLGTYVGSSSSVSGSGIGGGAQASADNIVSLLPQGDGTAQSNVNLSSDFVIQLTESTSLSFAFSADAFLRAMLSGNPLVAGNAAASYGWNATIRDINDNEIFNWSPDGSVGLIVGGTETVDAFDLTNNLSVSAISMIKDRQSQRSGGFAASTNVLGPGIYTLNIAHTSFADAFVEVPEPGSLALAGLALVGLGVARRASRQRTA